MPIPGVTVEVGEIRSFLSVCKQTVNVGYDFNSLDVLTVSQHLHRQHFRMWMHTLMCPMALPSQW